MKKFTDFIIEGGYVVQTKKPYFNAIDSNFLTTNGLFLLSLVQNNFKEKITKENIETILNFSKDGSFVRFPFSVTGIGSSESKHWDNPKTVSRDN